jgi:hypothetical protein
LCFNGLESLQAWHHELDPQVETKRVEECGEGILLNESADQLATRG